MKLVSTAGTLPPWQASSLDGETLILDLFYMCKQGAEGARADYSVQRI